MGPITTTHSGYSLDGHHGLTADPHQEGGKRRHQRPKSPNPFQLHCFENVVLQCD